MQTGYDNFWMYQNNRHEPVLSLPKYDNYSNAVLTDSYKQVLNGGHPNHFNSCIMSQNSVARYHQNDQHRMTSPQYAWPSSFHLLPFRSSYANNLHSQEAYSNQSNTLSYSSRNSQVQNYDSRYQRNSILNVPYMNNTMNNTDNCSNQGKCQSNESTNTAVARIRVKDVFSLNNNSLFDNNLHQTNQKEPGSDCPLNYIPVNHFTSTNSKFPSEYVDYEKINLLGSNNPSSHYGHTAGDQSFSCNQQNYLQHSNSSLYQVNAQISSESQFQVSGSKEKSLQSDVFKTNSLLTEQLFNHQKIREAGTLNARRNSNDALHGNKRIKVKPKRNSCELGNLDTSETANSCVATEKSNRNRYSGSLEPNDLSVQNATNISNVTCSQNSQENLTDIVEANSFSERLTNCKKGEKTIVSNKNSISENQMNGQGNDIIKITVPHSNQGGFKSLDRSDAFENNSSLSFPCFLEQKSQFLHHSVNKKIPVHEEINNLSYAQASQNNLLKTEIEPIANDVCSNSPDQTQSNRSCPTTLNSLPKVLESIDQGLLQRESATGLNNQKNPNASLNLGCSSKNISENFNPKTSKEDQSISTEIPSCNDSTVNSLIIKQETVGIEENSLEQYIPKSEAFNQIIKIEKNSEDSSLNENKIELQHSENLNHLENTQLLDVKNTRNIDFSKEDGVEQFQPIDSKKLESESKTTSNALSNTNNYSNSEYYSHGKEKCLDKNTKNGLKEQKQKVSASETNYKSEINRNKLDLLIEFLNEEEDALGTNISKETNQPSFLKKTGINTNVKKEDSNHSRRKLSKTCIVKNKNNSREMISLISHKNAQVETFKCSSKESQILETKNCEGKKNCSEEKMTGKNKDGENRPTSDESFESLEKHTEANNLFKTLQTQKDSLKFEKNINMSGSEKCQNTLEESSTGKECDIQEEENVINMMRAFQNLKTHFCMSCSLVSTVDSFWINVVSGELRCLNCFKKMLFKADDNILKLKAEKTDCNNDFYSNNDSQINPVQHEKTIEEGISGEENKQNTGYENDSKNGNILLDFTEFDCDDQKFNDLKGKIKQEIVETVSESKIEKIINKKDEEHNFIPDSRTSEIVNSSNFSGKRNELIGNSAPILRKILGEPKKLGVEESKINKLKEDIARKTKVFEGCSKQEVKELQGKLRKESFTKEIEVADKTQNSALKTSQIKSKESCSVGESFPLNYSSASEIKDIVKNRSLSPKFDLLESYLEEMFSDSLTIKSFSKEPQAVENSKQVSKENKKHELTDKPEKSCKKSTNKQEGVMEESAKTEKRLAENLQNQIKKRNNPKDEFSYQKLQVWDDYLKLTPKNCHKENCACHKIHSSQNIIRRNSKHEPFELLKSPLREDCCNYKAKLSEQLKLKDIHKEDDFKRKSSFPYSFVEKHKKGESMEMTKKRKNSESFTVQKVRVIEERGKKEIKPVTMHSSERSKVTAKEDNAGYKSKTSEYEKQNLKNFEEKSRRNSLSKTEYVNFEKGLKKDAKQVSTSFEKWKTKGDLPSENTKTSECSKHKGSDLLELPVSSSNENVFPVPKEHSKNEIKKIVESDDRARNYISKENFESSIGRTSKNFQKEAKRGGSSLVIEQCGRTEEKEKKYFYGKIPRKSYMSSDKNISQGSSSNYKSEELPDLIVKRKENTMSASPNRSFVKESLKSEKIIKKKEKEKKNEARSFKTDKEMFHKQGNVTIRKVQDQTKWPKNKEKNSTFGEQKEKRITRFGEKKEGVAYENEKTESATLLAKLIQKTKKLSWSILKEP